MLVTEAATGQWLRLLEFIALKMVCEAQAPARLIDGAASRAYHRRMTAQGPAPGVLLGHYRIVEQVGKGGMGVVFRAWDEQLERQVAVKVLPPGTFTDETARKRFEREARVLAKLNHPNIVMAFDFGQQDGIDYLVTEYVPGVTLDEKLCSGALPQKKVVELAVQLAKGLAAAHRAHIIHRDLKTENLRLTDKGELKMLDFGLARRREPVSEGATTVSIDERDVIGGTLPYMAPEQTRCEEPDVRTDIWAAGAVIYEMATGRRPFPMTSSLKLIDAIQHLEPPTPSSLNRQITPQLEAVITKALDKCPDRRYQSATELGVDLLQLSPTDAPSGIEQAIETAALMLGSDKSRGYCLEMICADFLAGANLDSGQPDVLLRTISRLFTFLPGAQKQAFAELVTEQIQ